MHCVSTTIRTFNCKTDQITKLLNRKSHRDFHKHFTFNNNKTHNWLIVAALNQQQATSNQYPATSNKQRVTKEYYVNYF